MQGDRPPARLRTILYPCPTAQQIVDALRMEAAETVFANQVPEMVERLIGQLQECAAQLRNGTYKPAD